MKQVHALHTFRFFPIIFLIVFSLTGMAETVVIDKIEYTIESGSEASVSGSETDISVADIASMIEYEGASYAVTSIGDYAFGWCKSLHEVSIPASVISIGVHAFYDCTSLEKYNVDENNEDYSSENGVLYNKDMSVIVKYPQDANGKNGYFPIPDSVISIAPYAFEDCRFLKSILISPSVISIGEGAFSTCVGLESLVIPETVAYIGDYAFLGCYDIKSLTIHHGVESIGSYAFCGCRSIESVEIPASVESIGHGIFSDCRELTEIKVYDNPCYLSEDGVLYDIDKIALIQFPAGMGGSFTIPNSVTAICEGAFEGCEKLTELEIPGSVELIGPYAFMWCDGLMDLSIPASVAFIHEGSFAGCKELKRVNIGDGVWGIGPMAFYGCEKIEELRVWNPVPPEVWPDAFEESVKLNATLFVPEESVGEYRTAPVWKDFAIWELLSEVAGIIGDDACSQEVMELYDLQGRKVYEGIRPEYNLSGGIYILRTGDRTMKIWLDGKR